MKIVPMNDETAPQVAEIEGLCFTDPWSESSIRSELRNPWAIWRTAMDGDTVAAYLGVQYGIDGADIMNIAVRPEYRRQGLAEMLLQDMYAILKEKNQLWLTLEVRSSNAPAIALYEKEGFQTVGLRKNYYRSPREDAILMTLYFNEPGKES